jgi:uncharacterized NAD(P)/FAD-binding protein YdhS
VAEADTIAIVGAGFSGTMLAVQLLRRTDARIVLIERSSVFGQGLAYSTPHPTHLLNVRSGRMSAFPDEPDHFVRWLERRRPEYADPDGFAPRMVYGEYLRAVLAEADAGAPDRLARVEGEVVEVRTDDLGAHLRLADGRELTACRAVLALGNPPPAPPGAPGLEQAPADRYIADPWAPDALGSVRPADEVLLLGTGLTMVDVLLALDEQGWLGRGLALSRRGLLPRPHDPVQSHPKGARPQGDSLSAKLRDVRATARGEPWGEVMDALRPYNQALWCEASPAERARFLRHLRPWWDVHRHRIAPGVGERVAAFRATDRLGLAAGRILSADPAPAGVWVVWRPRGERQPLRMRFDRVVNCTGPRADLQGSSDPLLRALFTQGRVRADANRLGLDTDPALRVVDARGRPDPYLYAVGPLTRGALWEIGAAPEIRSQVVELAERLAERAEPVA